MDFSLSFSVAVHAPFSLGEKVPKGRMRVQLLPEFPLTRRKRHPLPDGEGMILIFRTFSPDSNLCTYSA